MYTKLGEKSYSQASRVHQFRVLRIALITFGSRSKARSWMSKPQKTFGNRCAFEQINTQEGCKQVQDKLNQIAHGFFA